MVSPLRLLFDSDGFTKLALAELLEPAVGALGLVLTDCGRLPALPHMLRRGSLRKRLGADICDRLIPQAEAMALAPPAGTRWLDELTSVVDIDPGEAQLFASAAEHGLLLVTADKRALRALAGLGSVRDSLAGNIVLLDALLLLLYDVLGADELRRRATLLAPHDTMVRACLGSDREELRAALSSYFRAAMTELEPLSVWRPGVQWP